MLIISTMTPVRLVYYAAELDIATKRTVSKQAALQSCGLFLTLGRGGGKRTGESSQPPPTAMPRVDDVKLTVHASRIRVDCSDVSNRSRHGARGHDHWKGAGRGWKSSKLSEDQEERVVEDKLKLRASPTSLSLRASGISVGV